ncbi:PREDICTED: double-stranded RNA-binding protein 6-like [Ipomoea nil]|uniref:double-stranded RNA-binding protein 6-like n=1 Tax=Ipomoea nil TaxID=35883 RepID=UPI000901351F|nr:PREDICTED: double-stranded RNA-binding protein 6-like [Ipomoea nil]XP_019199424.1 PREDICTED: double-stranded RNA-binding protein 6-like [Ipomoea nil]XP_019199426.1 PREDICTED: double-stranded RNA-binding protein 6-like [Ipomoea nil]
MEQTISLSSRLLFLSMASISTPSPPANPAKKLTIKLPSLPSFTSLQVVENKRLLKHTRNLMMMLALILILNSNSKKKLQTYAKRMKLGLPTYCVQREDLCFKATVSLSGESFKSLGGYKTAKEAEEDAARFALMSLISAAFQKSVTTSSYKSLLQELGQSEGLAMPAYRTTMSGKHHHNLTFLSSVEIDGDVFHGTAAKSKKQAENNAAKVAYMSLIMEGKPHQTSGNSPGSSDNKNKVVELAALLNATTIAVKEENSNDLSPKESDSVVDHRAEMKTYLLCNRFKVYNHIPDMTLPKGTVLLPIRDGEWVVASLEFPNQK